LTKIVERTYNLEVADWHTFMVGEDHVVVHNGCPSTKDARRAFNTNKDFRRFVHQQKQAQGLGRAGETRNADLTDDQLLDLYLDWIGWGNQ
jgi:hypothetical protein